MAGGGRCFRLQHSSELPSVESPLDKAVQTGWRSDLISGQKDLNTFALLFLKTIISGGRGPLCSGQRF